jgi:PAS domain S-box-containing protein
MALFTQLPVQTRRSLEAVLDAAGRGLLVIDVHGEIVLLNGLIGDWLRLEVGQRLAEAQPILWSHAEPVVTGRKGGVETPLQVRGREYLAAVNPFYIEGELAGGVCIVVEAGQLEHMVGLLPSLATLHRELDAIIDSSSDGLFVCDGEANVLRMNPASEKIHQIDAEKIVGRNMHQLIEQGFIDRSAALETSLTRKPVTLLQNKDGRKLMSTASPVFDEAGQLARIVVSERDISELDRLQREIEAQEAMKDQLRDQVLELQQEKLAQRRVIARSPNMLRALQQAIKVSQAESSILLLGESGVGKGLVAELIHQHSARSESPLIKINCGAIPETLIEAELFGYEKGAFTGAQAKGKPGYLELADGGILFLDEIAELPLASQVKLLRFLEDGQVTRLGATGGKQVDVRILAATHRDLEEMVRQRSFRQDLYYRLNVIPILIPAVRDRKECLVPLLRHYIDLFARKNKVSKRLTSKALDVLTCYAYPGNVRELMNICERLVVMTETETIDSDDLPATIRQESEPAGVTELAWKNGMTLQESLDQVEKSLILQVRQRFRSQTEVAAALGVNQSTIARKLKKHGLS